MCCCWVCSLLCMCFVYCELCTCCAVHVKNNIVRGDLCCDDMTQTSQGLTRWLLWGIFLFLHSIYWFCLLLLVFFSACCWNKLIRSDNKLVSFYPCCVLDCTAVNLATVTSPFACWEVSISRSPCSLTSISCSCLSQIALGHPLHSPPVSCFHSVLWSLTFFLCSHSSSWFPPDRMALKLSASKYIFLSNSKKSFVAASVKFKIGNLKKYKSHFLFTWKTWWWRDNDIQLKGNQCHSVAWSSEVSVYGQYEVVRGHRVLVSVVNTAQKLKIQRNEFKQCSQ